MNLTTLTIESVHGVKQLLTLENFTVGPQPKAASSATAGDRDASKTADATDTRK